jgi:hypothetical protein
MSRTLGECHSAVLLRVFAQATAQLRVKRPSIEIQPESIRLRRWFMSSRSRIKPILHHGAGTVHDLSVIPPLCDVLQPNLVHRPLRGSALFR